MVQDDIAWKAKALKIRDHFQPKIDGLRKLARSDRAIVAQEARFQLAELVFEYNQCLKLIGCKQSTDQTEIKRYKWYKVYAITGTPNCSIRGRFKVDSSGIISDTDVSVKHLDGKVFSKAMEFLSRNKTIKVRLRYVYEMEIDKVSIC
jgi:hypothetical protein